MAVTNLQNFAVICISSLNKYHQLRKDPVTTQLITLQYQLNVMNLKKIYTLVHHITHSTKFLISEIFVLNLTKIIGVTDVVHGLIFKDTPLYMLYTLHEQYSQWNFECGMKLLQNTQASNVLDNDKDRCSSKHLAKTVFNTYMP